MRHGWLPSVLTLALISCTEARSPIAPTAIAGPTPIVATPSLPTAVPGVLSLLMPIEPGDSTNTAYGIAPFGYHAGDHAEDGHPGWDIEYRLGATVRAAAAGTVLSVLPDSSVAGRFTVQLEHVVGNHHYRTVYTNLASIGSGIAEDAVVQARQALGTAGTITGTVGTATITFAMTHFQLDDFEFYRETPNPNAVSPEPFLTAEAKALFDGLWLRAAFTTELIEPYPTNPRVLAFPASRTWTRAGGDGPGGVRFTRRSVRSSDQYEYALLAESGTAIESGTVTLNSTAKPYPTIDLSSSTSRRLGIYDIVSNELRLSLAPAGAARPTDLATASIYRTSR